MSRAFASNLAVAFQQFSPQACHHAVIGCQLYGSYCGICKPLAHNERISASLRESSS